MSDKEFTVHYQDGRVEGPISSKVIRDLIAAGVVSTRDYVSQPGGPPMPLASVPEFSDLVGGGAPSGLRPAPGGLPSMPGGLPSMPGGSTGGGSSMEDSTVMMQIPEGGFHPLAIQAEIEARKAAVARKKAEATAPPQAESEDLFSAAPAVTRTPLKTGASYQSSNNLAQGSISIKNPFSGRRPSSSGVASHDKGWPEAIIRLSARELRDKLLSLPVHAVLDLDVHCEPEQAQAAYESRHKQIQEHPDAKGSSMIARAAIEDLLNIIEKCRDVLCDRDQALTYIARVAEEGTDIPFNKYVSFQLAAIKPITGPIEGPKPMPGQSSKPASSGVKSGNFKANLPSSSVLEDVAKPAGSSPFASGSQANPFTSGNFASPFTSGNNPSFSSGANPAPVNPATAGRPSANPATSGSQPAGPPGRAMFSGNQSAPGPGGPSSKKSSRNSKKSSKKSSKKGNKKKSKRQQRLAQFAKAGWGEDGDPFEGHLAFGVGEPGRGLKHVIGLYGMVFIISFVLISIPDFDFGTNEFKADPNEMMIYIRNGMLFLMTFVGISLVRRESPVRVGLAPELVPALVAIPFACLIGALATPIARLPISPDADLGIVVAMLAIRAVGESMFFHGFVTRTLLIEMKEPAQALFISALMYGFYALTFVDILGSSPVSVIFGILVYGFGSGFPLAVIYWQTRSVIIPIIAELIIFMAVAWAGIEYMKGFGG